MDDDVLSGLCVEKTSYCTFQEQRKACDQSRAPHRQISHDRDTFIHMMVPIHSHWVAVQVTISPFTLKKHPKQTFFSSKLRYGPCCLHMDNKETLLTVICTVQKVVDSNYWPVFWNYSQSQCILDLPPNNDARPCMEVAKTIFKAYTAHPAPKRNLENAEPSKESASKRPRYNICCVQQPEPEPVGVKTKRGSIRSNTESRSINLQAETPPDGPGTEEATKLWKEGLAKASANNMPQLEVLYGSLSMKRKSDAYDYAYSIWAYADSVESKSKTYVWLLRYTASCCLMVGDKFPPPAETRSKPYGSRTTLYRWRVAAEAVNSILNDMLPTWKSAAYLIFNVLASGSILKAAEIGRIPREERDAVASSITNCLKNLDDIPSTDGAYIFNPIQILRTFFPSRSWEEISDAIGLSHAKADEYSGRSPALFHQIPDLCSRANSLMALPAEANSRVGVESSMSAPATDDAELIPGININRPKEKRNEGGDPTRQHVAQSAILPNEKCCSQGLATCNPPRQVKDLHTPMERAQLATDIPHEQRAAITMEDRAIQGIDHTGNVFSNDQQFAVIITQTTPSPDLIRRQRNTNGIDHSQSEAAVTLSPYSIAEGQPARGMATSSEPGTGTRAATVGGNFNLMGAPLDAAAHVSAPNLRPDTVPSIADQIDLLSQKSLTAEEMDPFTSGGLDNFINPLASGQPELLRSGGVSLFSDHPEFRYGGDDPMISGLPELLRDGGVALFEG